MKKILTSAIAVGSAMTLAMISAAQVFALDENALQDGIFNEQAIAEQQFVNSFSDETTREVAEYYLNGGLSLEETADMVKIYEEGVEQMSISTQSGDVTTPYYSTSKLCDTKHYLAVIETVPQDDVDELFEFTLNTKFLKCDPSKDAFICFPYTKSSYSCAFSSRISKTTATSAVIRTEVTANAKTGTADDTIAEPLLRFRLHYGNSTPKSENSLYNSVNLTKTSANGCVAIETFALGDVNHDGVVDAQDQSYLTKFLIGSVNDFDFKYSDGSNHFSYATNGLAADVNQDNVVDMLDAVQIGKYVSGQSSTLVD